MKFEKFYKAIFSLFIMKERGLTESEASDRLRRYGYNEIREMHKISAIKILLRQIRNNFIIYLLTAAVILSFFVGKSITAYVIIFVILMVIFTGFFQEYKAEKSINALKEMLTPVSIVLRNGKEREILSKEIVPGDIVILRNGEKIPADCIILEEKNLLINESILTGESNEVKKESSKNEKDYSDKNLLFMGTFIVDGKAVCRVLHTGMDTKFGHISKMISTAEKELPLQKKINKIVKTMVFIAICISVATGLLMFFRNTNISTESIIEIAILVIALCVSAFPEGFPVVLTTALSVGAYRMAQKNAIVNRMSIIETLGETTIICSDKTGTITKGEMTVKKLFCNDKIIDISGTGYNGKGEFSIEGKNIEPLEDETIKQIMNVSVLCNDARISKTEKENYSFTGLPTETALLIMGAKAKIFLEDFNAERIEEIPFNSERKMMSVMYQLNNQNYVYSKGAIETIIQKCKFMSLNGKIILLKEEDKKRILEINKKLTSQAYRTIAFAYKKVKTFSKDNFEEELVFLGFTAIEDPPREEVKQAIQECITAGIKVKMITGDNKDTAMSIARQINLEGKIMEGYEIDRLTDNELKEIVNEISIFARVRPEHKLRIVKALKLNGEIVAMTGDGVNDAPALKEAHIGVAMGKGGTDVSREVSDLILKDDNFATIVNAIKEGRTIFKNIKKFVGYQLSCNYAELTILFVGVLLSPFLGWQIPLLLALQILFMNLVTDDLPAIMLSLTPYSKDIMTEKPRKKKDILSKGLFFWLLINGISMAIISLTIFYIVFNLLGQGFEYARTTALVTLIMLEIFSAFNFMSFRRKISLKSFMANKPLLLASFISVIATLAIIYTPANTIFGTVPINLIDWVIAIISSVLIIFIFNILKTINNRKEIFELNGS